MKNCTKCGAQNPEEAQFCRDCGHPFEKPNFIQPERKRHWFVSTGLIICLIGNIISLIFNLFPVDVYGTGTILFAKDIILHNIAACFGVVSIFSILLLLYWRKFGFFILLGSTFITNLLTIDYLGNTQYYVIGNMIGFVIGFSIFFAILLIKRNGISAWKNMDTEPKKNVKWVYWLAGGLLALSILISTVNYNNQIEKISIQTVYFSNNEYTIAIPDHWVYATPDDDESFFYTSDSLEMFVAGVVEEQSEYNEYDINSLEEYYDFFSENFNESVTNYYLLSKENLVLNGNKAIEQTFTASEKTDSGLVNYYVKYCYIKTNTHFIKVECVSLEENKAEAEPIFNKIINSFKINI